MPCVRCVKLGLECRVPPTVKRGRPPKALVEARKAGRVLPQASAEPAAPEPAVPAAPAAPAAPATSAGAASGSQGTIEGAKLKKDATRSVTKNAYTTEAERVAKLNSDAASLAGNLWSGEQHAETIDQTRGSMRAGARRERSRRGF